MIWIVVVVAAWLVAGAMSAYLIGRFFSQREVDAHQLQEPRKHPSGHYHAKCACGLIINGLTLPAVWESFDKHLREVANSPW